MLQILYYEHLLLHNMSRTYYRERSHWRPHQAMLRPPPLMETMDQKLWVLLDTKWDKCLVTLTIQDWDATPSTPLKAKGGPKPKFINPADKHSINEGEHGFMTFTVEGDPAPTVEWFKGFKDLSVESRSVLEMCEKWFDASPKCFRYKFWCFRWKVL